MGIKLRHGEETNMGKCKKMLSQGRNLLVITAGATLYSAAISLFLDPNNLAPGGVSGISIILSRVSGIETGTLFFCINIPILLIGAWKFGIKFILSTIYCTALSSFLMNALSAFGPVTTEPILAALAGAVLVAVGLGIVFRAGSTSGGTDIIIKLLRRRFAHLKTGFLFMTIDLMVVTASAIIFRNIESALYAAIAVLVTSYVMDMVLYGRDGAKMIFIISSFPKKIADRLLSELDIGVTYLDGTGGYSGQEKKIILCIMRKSLSHKAEEIVKEEDPKSFMIVSSATEIYGEGYKSYFSQKL